ncbi:hypothetical protein MAR_033017 [Mya arenaria]|uniref:Uncharacterized protein n=1 Tax=Mya arenaria TaxID=6604 RepID=A0ABY7G7T8_MYAAR|nr:hypothetical protein MAR_033017 [Mya arenaria]
MVQEASQLRQMAMIWIRKYWDR